MFSFLSPQRVAAWIEFDSNYSANTRTSSFARFLHTLERVVVTHFAQSSWGRKLFTSSLLSRSFVTRKNVSLKRKTISLIWKKRRLFGCSEKPYCFSLSPSPPHAAVYSLIYWNSIAHWNESLLNPQRTTLGSLGSTLRWFFLFYSLRKIFDSPSCVYLFLRLFYCHCIISSNLSDVESKQVFPVSLSVLLFRMRDKVSRQKKKMLNATLLAWFLPNLLPCFSSSSKKRFVFRCLAEWLCARRNKHENMCVVVQLSKKRKN